MRGSECSGCPLRAVLFFSLCTLGCLKVSAEPTPITRMVILGGGTHDNGNTWRMTKEIQGGLKPHLLKSTYEHYYGQLSAPLIDTAVGLLTAFPVKYWVFSGDKYWGMKWVATLVVGGSGAFASRFTGFDNWVAGSAMKPLMGAASKVSRVSEMPLFPPADIYGKGGRPTDGDEVAVEKIARMLGLDPGKSHDFFNYAFLGSHINERVVEADKNKLLFMIPHIEEHSGEIYDVLAGIFAGDLNMARYGHLFDNIKSSWLDFVSKGFPPSLPVQVDVFLKTDSAKEDATSGKTLFVIGYQGNNAHNHDGYFEDLAGIMVKQIRRLVIEAGARNFLVLKSSLDWSPAVKESGNARWQVAAFNSRLEELLEELTNEVQDLRVTYYGGGAFLDQLPTEIVTSQPCLQVAQSEVEPDGYQFVGLSDETSKKTKQFSRKKRGVGKGIIHDSSVLEHQYQLLLEAASGKLLRCKDKQHLYFDAFLFSETGHDRLSQHACDQLAVAGYEINCSQGKENTGDDDLSGPEPGIVSTHEKDRIRIVEGPKEDLVIERRKMDKPGFADPTQRWESQVEAAEQDPSIVRSGKDTEARDEL